MAKYDMASLLSVRKDYCEICGSKAEGWPHHIKTRGAGGREEPWNLIQLCGLCHQKAQQYKIPRLEVVKIVAKREGISVEEIYEKQNWLYEGKMPHEVTISNPVAGKTYEEVLELYLFCLEKGQESMWERAAVLTVMSDIMGMQSRDIASALGCSASLVRKMTRTFNAFPSEQDRIPVLSFRHHQIAAGTNIAKDWLDKAADNMWSTRVLQEEIDKTREDDDSKKEKLLAQAERAVNRIYQVLDEGYDDISDWLLEELDKIIKHY